MKRVVLYIYVRNKDMYFISIKLKEFICVINWKKLIKSKR